MSDRLEQIAERVKNTVKDLPKDGKEHQITVTVGGDNHGSITLGDHIVVNEQPKSYVEIVHGTDANDLIRERKRLSSARFKAYMRRYINTPVLLFFTVLISVLAIVLADAWAFFHHEAPFVSSPKDFPANLILPLSLGAVFLAFGIPAMKRQRREVRIANGLTDQIDAIEQELHNRKYL